jgi:hypothetical protein
MDALHSTGAAAALTQGVIKDATGARIISKTLDKMNAFQSVSGPNIDAGYQFQKDVLNAAGIGTMLDKIA